MSQSLGEFFSTVDTLYSTGRTAEIEPFLKRTMNEHRVCCGGHDQVFTAALNELGTYYRGVSRYAESVQAFEEAGRDILSYGTKDTVDYATNRINLAGTLRLMKEYDRALQLYTEAANIYSRLEGKRGYHYATVLNNLSLVYLDLGKYAEALQYTEEALSIIRVLPGHDEEQSISLINRGTAKWHLHRTDEAAADAEKALAMYERLHEKGVHYANALNLCGTIAMGQKAYDKAYGYFSAAQQYIKQTFGENDDYRLAAKNADEAKKYVPELQFSSTKAAIHSIPTLPKDTAPAAPSEGAGLPLCKAYYEEIGKPMLEKAFASVQDRIAVGLVGDGSECLGFDDEISRDHDWGPSFCLWLTNDDYATFGQDLQKAYDTLPKTFRGFTRKTASGGEGRVGVLRISDFYRQFIGLSRVPQTVAEWNAIPEKDFAKATNGEVFADLLGRFTEIRQALLQYYPEDVRLKKIAVRAATMAQSGQYNYPRILKRHDVVAAGCALYEFVNAAMSMAYLLNKQYMPFYKWAFRGLRDLPKVPQMHSKLEALCTSTNTAKNVELIEDICTDIRDEWRLQGIADGPSDFLITYCADITSKIQDSHLRSLHIMQEF